MTTDIRCLLDKYFDGKTSAAEEQALRRYFAQDNLPGELEEYAPIFNFFHNESVALGALSEIGNGCKSSAKPKNRLRHLLAVAAVAAGISTAVLVIAHRAKQSPEADRSYAWADGKRITDPAAIRKCAELSLEKVKPEAGAMEKQLSFVFE